jgi:LmbE family N-acetylglucosaminyl deacetylase
MAIEKTPSKAVKRTSINSRSSGNIPAAANLTSRLKQLLAGNYAWIYAIFSVVILSGTTLLWAIMGAKLQQSNADQLANSYLFENSHTFHDATLPGSHSFLLKWPLFYLIKLFGYSSGSFITLTVLSVLATVAVLSFILYRIERRPMVFGTLYLALAGVLLMVPAQPYAGGLLPVNMAMLATRNLEYALYILTIFIFLRAGGTRSRWFWLAAASLGGLIASDKLFLALSVGAGLLGLLAYAIKRKWDSVTLSANWLMASLAGVLIGLAVLAVINAAGLIHISSNSAGAPYSAVSTGKGLILGILYGLMGILTNFGANPAYSATIVRDIPNHIQTGLLGWGGPAYLVNLAVLGVSLFCAFRIMRLSLSRKRPAKLVMDRYTKLAVILLLSSVAALGVFIASNHYYAVDARYLTVVVFALFISTAVWYRGRNWSPKSLAIAGGIISLGIIFGTVSAVSTYNRQFRALADDKARDTLVADALRHHPVRGLAADYWRALPIKSIAGSQLNVMPLSSCFSARDVLSSQAWQLNLEGHSFAYLLSLDRSLTDYRGCSLDEVINHYGRPNTSVLIAGSLSHPKELLLFYDRGAHKSSPKFLLRTPSTILPIALDELPYTSCSVPTIMNIVAHQDDDLLFMNPDLLHDIKDGHCVRTIYVTAGDAGAGQFYWLSRQQGSEAAYSEMLGSPGDIWIDRIVKLGDNKFITVANPRGNSKISLIFVHLPDGNPKGTGFPADHFQSLARLDSGVISSVDSVDGQSAYNSTGLATALTVLMHTYQPAEIRTQADDPGHRFPDHSDHMAVSRFVKRAYTDYENQQFEGRLTVPIKFYMGYPIHELPQNVTGDDLLEKEAAFFEYAGFDGGVCHSVAQCSKNPAYGAYLPRQYQSQF